MVLYPRAARRCGKFERRGKNRRKGDEGRSGKGSKRGKGRKVGDQMVVNAFRQGNPYVRGTLGGGGEKSEMGTARFGRERTARANVINIKED